MKKLMIILAVLFFSHLAFSQEPPVGFTYQGRILDASGSGVQDRSVTFKVQIRSNDGQCLLFEETHLRDMQGSGGVFSFVVGEGTNTNVSALNLKQVFDNKTAKTGASGCSYAPQTGDARKLRLSYDNGTQVVTLPADQRLMSVPYAIAAQSVQGLTPSTILQVSSQSTQAKLDSVLNKTTELVSLANGTSSLYAKSSDLPMTGGVLDLTSSGVRLPATPAGADYAVNKNYSDSNFAGRTIDLTGIQTGQTVVWNAAQGKWVSANLVSGTLTSVTAGAGLTGGTITSTGTISLSAVGTAGTYTKITTDAYGRVASGANLVEADIPSLATAGKVSGSAITSGTIGGTTAISTSGNVSATNVSASTISAQGVRIFDTTNSKKVTLSVSNSIANDFTLTLPTTAGASGQVLVSDGSGNLSWSSPSSLSATIVSGTAPITVTGTPLAPVVGINNASTSAKGAVQLASDGATTAGLVVQANDSRLNDSRAPMGAASGDLTGNYPAPTVSKIQGISVSSSAPVTGQFYRFGGSVIAPAYVGLSDLKTSIGTAQIPSACTASQALSYNSVVDQLICQTISISSSNISGLGSAAALSVATSGDASSSQVVVGNDSRLSDSRAPLGAASGDLTGNYPSPVVSKLLGRTLSTTAPIAGQVLTWNNSLSQWEPQIPASAPVTTVAGRTGSITLSSSDISGLGSAAGKDVASSGDASSTQLVLGNDSRLADARTPMGSAAGDLSGAYPSPTVSKIQGRALASTAPSSGQVLTWNQTSTQWEPQTLAAAPVTSVAGRTGVVTLTKADVSGLGSASEKDVAASGDASSTQVVLGSDSRLTDSRAPNGAAGGDLAGTYPNPTLAATGVTSGTYTKVTVDTKGRVTSGTNLVASDIPNLNWSKITSTPSTLTGYGITDAVVQAGGVKSLQAGLQADLPNAGTSGRIYVSTDTNRIYFDNGSGWILVSSNAGSGGTLTSVSAGAGLSGGTITTTGTISLPNVGTSGTYSKVTTDAYGRITSGSSLSSSDLPTAAGDVTGAHSSLTVQRIQGIAVDATAPTSGQVLTYNNTTSRWQAQALPSASVSSITGSSPVSVSSGATPVVSLVSGSAAGNVIRWSGSAWTASNLSFSDLRGLGGAQQFPTTCTSAQTTNYSSVTDSFSCASIAISKSQVSGLGGAASLNVGTSSGTVAAGDDSRLANALQSGATASGDLSGTLPSPVVAKLQGVGVSSTAPTSGQFLRFNSTSSAWEPTTVTLNSGTVTSVVAGSGLTGGTISSTGTIAVDTGTTANKIVQLDSSARLPAVDGSRLTNMAPFANMQVFDASGTFTVPSGVTKLYVQVWGGGGGGGGGGNFLGIGNGGGGGAGGGYGAAIITPSLTSYTVTIGTGGANGTSSTAGSAGNASSFGSVISASGGAAGGAGSSQTFAAGGTSSAAINVNGGRGKIQASGAGGEGGTGASGGGEGGPGSPSSAAGADGVIPGGGGGGGSSSSVGGSGARGRVIVWY